MKALPSMISLVVALPALRYVFTQILLWGNAEGYRCFNLGMAPFSGLDHHRLPPLRERFGSFLVRHGEHFYKFQWFRGLEDEPEPEWEARFLVAPGSLSLAFVLTRIAALGSGGLGGSAFRSIASAWLSGCV